MNKNKNRNDFPETAKIIDMFREVFPNAKIIYCEENNKKAGIQRKHKFLEFKPTIHVIKVGVLQ